jgi:hypothetical protein
MNRIEEDEPIREQLTRELEGIEFTERMKREVMRRAKPIVWEREVRIPVSLAAMACLVVFLTVGLWLQTADRRPAMPILTTGKSEFVVLHSGVFRQEEIRMGWEP